MPVVRVHKNFNPATYSYNMDGVQYVEDVLTLPTSPDTATIYLSKDIYNTPGYYVLFDYSESSNPTPVVGDINQLVIDITDLDPTVISGSTTIFNDLTKKQIVLIIYANQNNGTQYIEGTLTINDPITIYLSSSLFGSPGTYILFDWSGGGSFVGDISNITIVAPLGRSVDGGVSPNGCAISGSTITVKLL